MLRPIILSSSLLVLTACASLAPETPESAHAIAMPAAYDYAGEVEALAAPEREWWDGFETASLDQLVSEALAANQTLAQGVANVEAARAALKVANAAFLPQASGSLSASSNTEGDGLDDVDASGRLSASYQLDLFGANAASREAAQASLEATIFSQRALELTVQSDVATNYFALLAAREQLEVARRNLEISERIYDIVQVRYEAGAISGYDVSAQEAQLANARARIPQIEAQITGFETALAILTGRAPQGYDAPEENILSISLPETDPGLPSDLLLRRPDLMQAEASLRGANANIKAARAAYFPSIDLGAGVSSLLTGGGDLTGSLSASLAQTIFSGGRLEGQVESAEARRDAQLAGYRQAILGALRDVDVSLKSVESNAVREDQLLIAREAAGEALEAVELRYRAGTDDLTSLLTAQQTYFDASNTYVQGRLDRLTAAINLYVALGGGYGQTP
ncbi:efflux transporter outer membrane subunit [Henriciella aquimarina]|uniref:efflux transporter outer membrane subunit n=1 Tax=Henriciella aquimarina TaxID=545261 RepID=UPI000A0502BA|nr:efflux transporter outer membrane subunit [Henriciella aquimarina]